MSDSLFKDKSLPDKALNLLVLLTWGQTLLTYMRGFYTRLPISEEMVAWVNPTIIIVLILIGFSSLMKKVQWMDIFFYVGVVVVYYLEYQMFPNNQVYLDQYTEDFFFAVIPCFFTGLCLSGNDYSKGFYWVSIFSIVLIAVRTFILGNYGEQAVENRNLEEHMAEAYLILPHAIYMLYAFFRERKTVTLLFLVLSLYMLLSFGSRGSFLAYIGFAFIYIVLKLNAYQRKRGLVYLVPLVIVLIPITIYANEIVLSIALLINNVIPDNRIAYSIINNAFVNYMDSSGRDVIHETIMNELSDGQHFWGLGLCGDRMVTNAGSYSHNFGIEMWASFGYFIGSVILIIIIIFIYKAFRACKRPEEKELMAILFITGLFPLMFSSTFLAWPSLFFFFGYCISLIRNKYS